MSTARDTILGEIRDVMAGGRPAQADDYAAILRGYRRTSVLDRAGLVELFTSRIVHYDGSVRRCSPADLPATLANMLASRGKTRIHVAPDIDRTWLPSQPEFVADRGAAVDDGSPRPDRPRGPHAELDASQGVLTGCAVAIALTGTIVLTHGPGQARRALTLVPDYHLTVVFEEQIVETVPEAIARVARLSPALVTTISGPSATSDIEMTRIKGVHGPRTLDVVIVGQVGN